MRNVRWNKKKQKKAFSLGADAFLKKPASNKKILECVEKLLNRKITESR